MPENNNPQVSAASSVTIPDWSDDEDEGIPVRYVFRLIFIRFVLIILSSLSIRTKQQIFKDYFYLHIP